MNISVASQAADFWTAWSPTAEVVGGFATGVAAAFGGMALFFAYNQIKSAASIAREQDAYRVYTDYLKICIDYPQFSSSDLAKTHLNLSNFVGVERILAPESERYLWIISYMMSACEKIFDALPDRTDWKSAIGAQVGYHAEALKEVWPNMKKHYKSKFVAFVDGVLSA